MMRSVAVHIRTSREVKGDAYAARYPGRGNDLWVVACGNRRKERHYIGPPTVENQARAEKLKAELEAALRVLSRRRAAAPTLRAAAAEYLRIGMDVHQLAPTTKEDRRHLLSSSSPWVQRFGGWPMDRIRGADLFEAWSDLVVKAGKARSTGRNYLAAISAVYAFTNQRGLALGNPVDEVRLLLRHANRTKAGRQASQGSHAAPIEPLEVLLAIVATALRWPEVAPAQRMRSKREKELIADVPLAVLLQLDAGLRLGEAVGGLRWPQVWIGESPKDTSRALRIEDALARGRHEGRPKSGRVRVVAMSLRLRELLRARWIAKGQPKKGPVVAWRSHKRFREEWAEVCTVAGAGSFELRQLRDSYGSYLLSAGVNLGYISQQQGHANAQVTARHYARWVGDGGYREPMALLPGEVPADLLARLVPTKVMSVTDALAGAGQ